VIAAHIAAWALNKSTNSAQTAHAAVGASTSAPKKRKTKKRVLDAGGGKQQPMPAQPTPLEQAQAREWEAAQQAARDAARQAQEDARAQEAEAKRLDAWRASRGAAVQGVKDYGTRKLQSYGLDQGDPYGIWESFTGQLDSRNGQVQEGQDFAGLINESLFDEALSGARNKQRTTYSRDLMNDISDNYLDDTFANTIDDPILDAILGEQFGEANSYLTSARDRGQLNNIGFERALSNLEKEKQKARGELETLGRGVLTTNRNSVASKRDAVGSRINNFDFGDTIDLNSEKNRIRSTATDLIGSLDTDIRRSIGDRDFFDPNSLVAKSAAFTGTSNYNQNSGGTNPTGNPLMTVFTDQQRNKQTQGAF
jgi:hypothetical protein